MEILNLFPTPVGIINVTEDLSPLEKFIKNLPYNKIAEGSSQISLRLDVLEDFPKVSQLLLKKFGEYVKNISPDHLDFQITTSWGTRCLGKVGNYSSVHSHKNSMYSGVLYFSNCESSGYFKVYDPLDDHKNFYIGENRSPNLYSSSMFMIKPEKNDLIFFPSYIKHMITPYYEKENRYSLAFNIVPVGRFGGEDSTLTIKNIRSK